nr:MAG TPA: hypothetical protein [Caudoviricetes sp.]
MEIYNISYSMTILSTQIRPCLIYLIISNIIIRLERSRNHFPFYDNQSLYLLYPYTSVVFKRV